MQVSKIFFSGLDAKVPNNEIKTDVTKYSNSHIDEKKSNTAKYMIGATSLAAAIAIGIIGHKNNWWRKASDLAADLSKKGAESADNVDKNAQKIISTNPKPIQDIDYLDFSKIEGESYENQGLFFKDLKNEEGKLVRTFGSLDGKTLSLIKDYDPATGNLLKKTFYREYGETLGSIMDYDPKTGNRLKRTCFKEDGKTLDFIMDYNPSTGKFLKKTSFKRDGKTLDCITDYDPVTGKLFKKTFYQEDGETLRLVVDYDPATGKFLKKTFYNSDGTIDRIVNAS